MDDMKSLQVELDDIALKSASGGRAQRHVAIGVDVTANEAGKW
jgi:hypothetical protein